MQTTEKKGQKRLMHTQPPRFMWFPKTRAMYMGSLQFYYDGYMEEIPIKRIGHLSLLKYWKYPQNCLEGIFHGKALVNIT